MSPLASSTIWILFGIESERFCNNSTGVAWTQSFLISSINTATLDTLNSWSLSFIQFQRFSIGFRSGELPGQSMILKLWRRRTDMVCLLMFLSSCPQSSDCGLISPSLLVDLLDCHPEVQPGHHLNPLVPTHLFLLHTQRRHTEAYENIWNGKSRFKKSSQINLKSEIWNGVFVTVQIYHPR